MYRDTPEKNAFVVSAVNGVVAAYRLEDGSVAWKFQAPEGTIPVSIPNALRVQGNRVLVAVPRHYGNHAFAAAFANPTVHVFCLEYATGRMLWKRDIVCTAKVNIALLVEGGHVLVVQNGVLFAFVLDTGEPAWSLVVDGATRSDREFISLAGQSGAHNAAAVHS